MLHRHAKLMKNGRPVFCTPSRAEMTGRVPPRQSRGTDGKVIYPTREAAEAAARELEALGAGALRSYMCGRSRRGHFHLTTDADGASAPRSPRLASGPRHARPGPGGTGPRLVPPDPNRRARRPRRRHWRSRRGQPLHLRIGAGAGRARPAG